MKKIPILAAFGAALFGTVLFGTVLWGQTALAQSIPIAIPSPRGFDLIDILSAKPLNGLSILLPDGRTLTPENAEDLGFRWETVSDEEIPAPSDDLSNLMLPGAGQHTVIVLPAKLKGGDFEIRIDPQGAETEIPAVRHVAVRDAFIKIFLRLPGIQISNLVQVAPLVKNEELKFELQAAKAGNDEALSVFDVVVTDPDVRVSLVCPDGSVVTEQTAGMGFGVEKLIGWPAEYSGEDEFGFGVAFLTLFMLPMDGVHHMIFFADGIPQEGIYRVVLDAAGASQASEARAMFLPSEALKAMNPEPDFF
jgi:hypothetical protein